MRRRRFLGFLAAIPAAFALPGWLTRLWKRKPDVIEVEALEMPTRELQMGWYYIGGFETQWSYGGDDNRMIKDREC